MKKTRQQLEEVERLVQRAYNRRNRKLRESLDKPYDPNNPELGYSYKTDDPDTGVVTYNVVAAKMEGKEDTCYRIKLHEYGHIYLTHFEGIYEELDRNICNIFKNYRGQIIDVINKNCGISFGEKLVERVIDDPVLNHSLHNIAMDMEVNSKLLSNEDIEEMETDISDYAGNLFKERIEELIKKSASEDIQKRMKDQLDKMQKESKVKLILPCRYHLPNGDPFPDQLSYPEYLMMIVKNLDQFVKMLISIDNGGNGDTGDVSDEDLQNALGGGMGSLSDLMRRLGMSDDGDEEAQQVEAKEGGGNSEGLGQHDTSNSGGKKHNADEEFSERSGKTRYYKDHGTASRDEADKKRELGEITAGGGAGCGDGGGPCGVRTVSQTDEVDSAIEEAVLEQKNRVIQFKTHRDVMKNWNLGRNRTVICPSISQKVKIDTNPKIVYLIDISGSMDTHLIDRILNTIAKKMRKINKGLRYDIITWSHVFGEHIKDIDPKKGVPRISTGGGTRMAEGIKFFKEHYDESATLIIASDFEDYLEEWCNVLQTMPRYSVWGFNYGRRNYDQKWPKNFKLRNFNKYYGC